jgi:hypothetical protein
MIIYGTPHTAYMRSAVMVDYEAGSWTGQPSELQMFTNEATLPAVAQGVRQESIVSISPVRGATGNLPVFKDLLYVRCHASFTYSAEYGTISTPQRVTDSYECSFDVTDHDRTALANATAPNDQRYLTVPTGIASDLGKLASFVTEGKSKPYAKAMALRDYLRSSYIYDSKYDPAPPGEDPVLWFLLHGKKGVCTQFNSALALMARSEGIPARYVVGFVIDPDSNYQSIRLAHAHAYCEIELEGIGWVIIDAAPLSFTEPFHVDNSTYWKDDVVTSEEPKNESLGKIAGWISQPLSLYTSAPVPDLELGLYNGTDLMRVTKTDGGGTFVFGDLDWGTYILRPFLTDRWTAIDKSELVLDCGPYAFFVVSFSVRPNTDFAHGDVTFTELSRTAYSLEQRTGFNVSGTVRDAVGDVQEGMGVEIMISNASTPWDRIICGLGTVAGGSFDIDCMVPDGIPTGHYVVTAMAMGNSTHASSECSAGASLSDETVLVLTVPRRMPQGVQIQVRAHLGEKRSGLAVAGAEIWLDGVATCALTNELGNVTFNMTYHQTGEHGAAIRFEGSTYLGNSNASVTFEVMAISAEILTDTIVRGETNVILGRVYAQDMPCAGINVTFRSIVDGDNSSSNITNFFGFFFVTKDIPEKGLARGPLEISYVLGNYTEGICTVRVKDRPMLTASASGISADMSLASPSSEPIPGAQLELTAGNVTLLTMTDSKGAVEVGIPSGTETVRVQFQGNEDYASAFAEVQVLPAGFDWSSLLIVAGTVAAAGTGAGAIYVVIRHRRPADKGEPEIIEEIMGPYQIGFPQIERGFPAKWGIDEQLEVSVEGKTKAAKLLVDGAEVPLTTSGSSGQSAVLLLPPGAHEIVASGPDGRSMRLVRVVDYREETGRLYHQAFDALASNSKRLTPDHTPREIEAIVSEALPNVCLEALEVAVSRFEVAGFSDHKFTRSDYVEMELAVEGIKAQCGRRRAG